MSANGRIAPDVCEIGYTWFAGAAICTRANSEAKYLTPEPRLLFVLVCIGVMIMRRKNPERPRPFRAPLVPVLGVIFCLAMIISVDSTSKIAAGSWTVAGLFVYFLYARRTSNPAKANLIRNAGIEAGN